MSRFTISVLTIAAVAGFAFSGTAQQPEKPKSKPLATPVPTLTGAEIISRAEDLVEKPLIKPPDQPNEKKPTYESASVAELTERIKKLESAKSNTYDEKQKRLLLNLDILTRAEQRSESLRKQMFEMIEKENTVKARLDQVEFESRSEVIDRSLQLTGSLRPEEIRENRRKSLNAEKANLNSLLTEIQLNRSSLVFNLSKADQMVEKLRAKLEKDIDDSFLKDDEPDLRDPQI